MNPRRTRTGLVALSTLAAPITLGLVMFNATGDTRGTSLLPPVPVPVNNPITEDKRALGKILFFDEQLSTDNTTACATCHQSTAGGADPRIAIHPGLDQILGTPDDARGSPGVINQDASTDYDPHPLFALQPQATTRAANPMINAAYSPELFWDGRASDVLIDPITQDVVLDADAALEVQALAPPTSSVEMGHADRDWNQIAAKLAHARPLALASSVPADASDAVLAERTYPNLFERAFGTPEITASRIAMAIATYQRTLIADQTPWDEFILGNPAAMTPAQTRGWQVFLNAQCTACHVPPLFTNQGFRNIGVRPAAEDPGRQTVTGDPFDAGKFKVPGLRNTGLKPTYMHNGQFNTLNQVIAFYAGDNQFEDNLDPSIPPIQIAPPAQQDLVAFLDGGLTDVRVANAQFPFDAPDLFFRPGSAANPALLPATGRPDSQGRLPRIVARTPPLIGTDDFRIGVSGVAEGSTVTLVRSLNPPVNGEISPDEILAVLTATDDDAIDPVATAHLPIPFSPALDGQVSFLQWRVDDPALPQPALSRVARVEAFCGFGDCATGCLADLDRSQSLDFFDVSAFLNAFNAQQPAADLASPLGAFNFFDIAAFLAAYNAGC
jgi:cytochrome c peroxidase